MKNMKKMVGEVIDQINQRKQKQEQGIRIEMGNYQKWIKKEMKSFIESMMLMMVSRGKTGIVKGL